MEPIISISKTIKFLKQHGFKVRKKKTNTNNPSLSQQTALRLLSSIGHPISKITDDPKQRNRLYSCVEKGYYPNEEDSEQVIFYFLKQSVKINDLVYEYVTKKSSESK